MSDVTITLSQADVGQLLEAVADRTDRLNDSISLFTDANGELLSYLQENSQNHITQKRAALEEMRSLRERLIRVWRPEPIEGAAQSIR